MAVPHIWGHPGWLGVANPQKYSENYYKLGIIAVEKSSAGPTTTVIIFLYSWHLLALLPYLCRVFCGEMLGVGITFSMSLSSTSRHQFLACAASIPVICQPFSVRHPPPKTLVATHTARLQVGWYIIFMASAGGGGEVVKWRDDCKRDFGLWFKSRKSLMFFSRTTIRKWLTNNRNLNDSASEYAFFICWGHRTTIDTALYSNEKWHRQWWYFIVEIRYLACHILGL